LGDGTGGTSEKKAHLRKKYCPFNGSSGRKGTFFPRNCNAPRKERVEKQNDPDLRNAKKKDIDGAHPPFSRGGDRKDRKTTRRGSGHRKCHPGKEQGRAPRRMKS